MAESYWVTFRIASDATYQKRYDGLLETMIEARGQNGSWAEPTSFWLVNSDLVIDAFTKKLSSKLNTKTDLLLVRCLAKDSSCYFGTPEHPEILKEFLPAVKKVG